MLKKLLYPAIYTADTMQDVDEGYAELVNGIAIIKDERMSCIVLPKENTHDVLLVLPEGVMEKHFLGRK